jgi:hypothetical protein
MVKGKGFPQQAEVAQGIPGRLWPRIFLTFDTTRLVGLNHYATPGHKDPWIDGNF